MEPQSVIGLCYEPSASYPTLSGSYLAQVIDVAPDDHSVLVLLPGLTGVGGQTYPHREGLRAAVLEHRAGPWAGDKSLPRAGDWGVVVFPHGTHQYPVWLGSLYQSFNSLATSNPREQITHHDSGVYERIDEAGNCEFSHPSGTYLRIGDGTALDPRTRYQRKNGEEAKEQVAYDIPSKPIPTVHLQHATGLTITIDPQGNLTVDGPTNVLVRGDDVTVESTHANPGEHLHIGGAAGEDAIALKAGLENIQAVYNSHTHDGGAIPDQQITYTPDQDYTSQSKAT